MWIVSATFLAWSWKKAKVTYSHSITSLLAISSAFVFAAQMINFPIAFGTSGHLVGGTFLAVLLGPYAAILGMTIVLIMQALFFADGGIIAFGMNVFNMAIIGGMSFFAASWLSVMIGALICSLEIAPAFVGGVLVTVPSMLFFHAIIGLGEGTITMVLVSSLQRLKPAWIGCFSLLKESKKL